MKKSTKKDTNIIDVHICPEATTCCECKERIGRSAWITITKDSKPLCLSCSDLDHLAYLPAGDAALTRRSRKYSPLSANVLRWNRRRRRHERQGILVTEEAIERAEEECLADSDLRARRRERDAERREKLDQKYIEEFAKKVSELYPGCPSGREQTIARHACEKYSGRVGRSSKAKELNEKSVTLAVIAHIRHLETNYDSLLAKGTPRKVARVMIEDKIKSTLARWRR